MNPARVVTEVSSTVRRLAIRPARVRELVEATLAAEKIRDAMVSVAFVGRATIARINHEYLGHDGATDVISFGMGREAPGMPAVGDVYICPEVASRNARRLGISEREELSRLVVHGTLHVVGHDHPDDESRTRSKMWKKQERILAARD
ncbi:MAG: rRNA maturation RNase YbeY [Gemmatimonadaceae bacterium]|nr:rRNA maturation RNase YbeY [Gemmatimonadaceae bacterium]